MTREFEMKCKELKLTYADGKVSIRDYSYGDSYLSYDEFRTAFVQFSAVCNMLETYRKDENKPMAKNLVVEDQKTPLSPESPQDPVEPELAQPVLRTLRRRSLSEEQTLPEL